MSEKCCCGSCCKWLSGFFAAPAIGHLIRIVFGWEITIKGEPVTMKISWTIMLIAAILSVLFGLIAHRKDKAGDTPASSCCS